MRDVYIGPIKAVLDFLDNSTMDFILCVSKDNLSKPLPSNVMQLDFGDTVDADDPAAFSAQLAAEVASFLRRPDARLKLFVCCDCGVSRSAALAAAIRCADGNPYFRNPASFVPTTELLSNIKGASVKRRLHFPNFCCIPTLLTLNLIKS